VKPRRFGVSKDVHGLDTERILRALSSHEVEYVLVGGLAALAYGSTIATADADLLPRPAAANLDRLLDALEDLGAEILLSEQRLAMEAGEPWEVVDLNEKGASALASAEAWHFTTSAGPIDVVVTVTGVGPYEAHLGATEERVVFGLRILVAGLDDLIASKEATMRPKDEAILRELRELRGEDTT
jgi:hypothetical protein